MSNLHKVTKNLQYVVKTGSQTLRCVITAEVHIFPSLLSCMDFCPLKTGKLHQHSLIRLKTYLLAGGKEKKKKLTFTEHLLCSRNCPKLFVCSRYFNPHNHLQGPEVVQGEASVQSSRAFHFLSRTWRLLKVECLQKASAYLLSSHTYWEVVFNGTEHSVRTQEHPCPAHTSTAVHDDGSRQVAPAHVANILYETVCWGRRAVVWPVDELQLLYNVTSSCLVRQREREESGWGMGVEEERGRGRGRKRRKIYQLFIFEILFQFLIHQ